MYGVEGGLDNTQLEEQGRADWAARGFDAEYQASRSASVEEVASRVAMWTTAK